MADYFGTFFISKLPFCLERQEIINGEEKTCLVIPCDEAQMGRTRNGSWFMKLKVNEMSPNAQLRSHNIRLGYRDNKEVDKARRLGYYDNANKLGYLYPRSQGNDDFKIDRTNNMTPIICYGKIFLESIQRDDIKTDPMTGRKYIDFSFRKTQMLDAFGNSHEVVVGSEYGEHQIGVAKESRDEEGWFSSPNKSSNPSQTNEKTMPSEYDGYLW